MTAAVGIGALAAGFAIALTAVSGWLIVRASTEPVMMYLMVAIVGVRFFGIGRSALRYTERLLTHDAVFSALTALRLRVWRGLAAHGPAGRAALSAPNALARLIGDADQVRDLAPRVVAPPLIGVTIVIGTAIALGLIYPLAGVVALVAGGLALIAAPLAALAADRAAGRRADTLRERLLRATAALFGAAADAKANGVSDRLAARVAALDERAGAAQRRAAWAHGLGQALVVALCGLAALLMLPVAAPAVARGELAPEAIAVLVLTPLGLVDPLCDVVTATLRWPALSNVLRRLRQVTTRREHQRRGTRTLGPVHGIRLSELAYRYPDAPSPAFQHVNATAETGEWLVISGPSGSGKSTLLAVLLRHLAPTSGRYLLNAEPADEFETKTVRRRIAWCPQEAHLFDSTLRANLLLARPREQAPDDSELDAALRAVGLGSVLDAMPDGLDTRIGTEGSALSGGQRQRVAVARTLLAGADAVLIDEPTAHLDEHASRELIADLRVALRHRLAVLVTHDSAQIESGDRVLRLGGSNGVVREEAGSVTMKS
jgi:ATP-binding cassette subfamily C protein CydCD